MVMDNFSTFIINISIKESLSSQSTVAQYELYIIWTLTFSKVIFIYLKINLFTY